MVEAKWVRTVLFVMLFLSLTAWEGESVFAQEEEPPKRQTSIVISSTNYEWWLLRWTDNFFVCQVLIDHPGPPAREEIYQDCDQEVYDQWISTPPCKYAQTENSTFSCQGLYLYEVGFQPGEQTVTVDLPPPALWLTLSGCSPSPPQNLCLALPSLVVTGEEPLPNEQITAIHVLMNEQLYTCDAEVCAIPLQPTLLDGLPIEFWADSSFGDSSEHFTAQVRVIDSGVSAAPGSAGWYVDVLSSQWQGGAVESCAQIWQSFPSAGGPPEWLSNPNQEQLLASDEPYHYLAGRMISQGLVDATQCPGNGLLENGYANACGIEKARPTVDLWQNQFDPRIIAVAEENGLPSQIMKNLFAQESQFWPGVFRMAKEFGLGQLTDMGADTVLLWNDPFFKEFCPLVLDEAACNQGYLRLEENEQALLRGALAMRANADCRDCPTGIDLTYANFSVTLFAQGLLANCDQVGQTILNATQRVPGTVSSYEDLWRFTLANYHGGSGCLAFAIHSTWAAGQPLTWENVSPRFTLPCQGVLAYVDLITR